ncbi:hypothetical protein SAFG77S_02944 [Streptomyces afghaniensis]
MPHPYRCSSATPRTPAHSPGRTRTPAVPDRPRHAAKPDARARRTTRPSPARQRPTRPKQSRSFPPVHRARRTGCPDHAPCCGDFNLPLSKPRGSLVRAGYTRLAPHTARRRPAQTGRMRIHSVILRCAAADVVLARARVYSRSQTRLKAASDGRSACRTWSRHPAAIAPMTAQR